MQPETALDFTADQRERLTGRIPGHEIGELEEPVTLEERRSILRRQAGVDHNEVADSQYVDAAVQE